MAPNTQWSYGPSTNNTADSAERYLGGIVRRKQDLGRSARACTSWIVTSVSAVVMMIAATFASSAVAQATAGAITGAVVTSSGSPVTGVAVIAANGAETVGSTTSASDGSFTLAVPDGTYDFHLIPPAGSSFSETDLPALAVSSSEPIQLVLVGIGGLVTVRGAAGLVAGGVQLSSHYSGGVSIFTPDGSSGAFAPIGADGSFSAQLFSGVTYQFNGGVTSEFGHFDFHGEFVASTSPLDVTIPVSKVTVVVKDESGNPVQGAYVQDQGGQVANPTAALLTVSDSNTRSGGTDSSGSAIWYLPTGYQFNGTPQARLFLSGGAYVPVAVAAVTGDGVRSFTVPTAVTVRGAAGLVAGGVQLSSHYSGGVSIFTPDGSSGAFAPIGADGSFSAQLFSGVTYQFNGGVTSEFGHFDFHGEFVASTSPLDVTIPVSKVTVVVKDESGNPVQGAYVQDQGGQVANPTAALLTVSDSNTRSGGTDSSGSAIWYLPTDYQFNGTPQARLFLSGGAYVPVAVAAVTGDGVRSFTVPTAV